MVCVFGGAGERGVEDRLEVGRGVILRVVHNQRMDSESDEEFDEDDDVIEKPIEIIKVDEEYEVENDLLGLE
jgi:hypothetical protein